MNILLTKSINTKYNCEVHLAIPVLEGQVREQYTVSSSDTVREYEVSDVQTEKCHQICLNLDDGIRTAVLSNF